MNMGHGTTLNNTMILCRHCNLRIMAVNTDYHQFMWIFSI